MSAPGLERRAFLGLMAAGSAGAVLPATLSAAPQEAGPVTTGDLEAATRDGLDGTLLKPLEPDALRNVMTAAAAKVAARSTRTGLGGWTSLAMPCR